MAADTPVKAALCSQCAKGGNDVSFGKAAQPGQFRYSQLEPLRVVEGADDRLQDGQIAAGPGVFHSAGDYFGSQVDRSASITTRRRSVRVVLASGMPIAGLSEPRREKAPAALAWAARAVVLIVMG